jgi:hypothetical protein
LSAQCQRCGAPVQIKRDFTGVMVNGIIVVLITVIGGVVVWKKLNASTSSDSTTIAGKIDGIGN